MSLYPFQKKGVKEILTWKKRRVIYVAPTGAGKTQVAVAVIKATPGNVLFFAHRQELVTQALDSLFNAGLKEHDLGLIMRGRHNPEARIQVATIQSLRSHLDDLPDFKLIVIDEAHRSLAPTYQELLEMFPNAKVLGLTATPARTNGAGFDDTFEDMILAPSVTELVKGGYLAAPVVYSHTNVPDMKGVSTVAGDFNQREVALRMKRVAVGDIFGHYWKHAKGMPAVGFASSIELSIRYTKEFNRRGVNAEHIDGTTSSEEREAILSRLESGETSVVWNVDVLTEGWDAKHVRCIIVVRPTKSITKHLQMIGRIMRPGRRPIVLDHVGNCAVRKLGLPTEDREWSLEGYRAPQNIAYDVNEKTGEVTSREEASPLEHVEGELKVLTTTERKKIEKAWSKRIPGIKKTYLTRLVEEVGMPG